MADLGTDGTSQLQALLAAATTFTFGPVGLGDTQAHIDVEARPGVGENGETVLRWAIVCWGWVYDKDGRWTYSKTGRWAAEPIPSLRDDKYMRKNRWDDRDEAIAVARGLIADGHPNTPAWRTGRRYP